MTREELRDYVEEQRNLNNIPYHVYSTLLDGIDTLEQEPKWIPVSERLPKPRVDVWANSDIGQIQGYYEEHVGIWYASFGQGRDYMELTVNAWMPLPAPFESQESEE